MDGVLEMMIEQNLMQIDLEAGTIVGGYKGGGDGGGSGKQGDRPNLWRATEVVDVSGLLMNRCQTN